MNLATAHRLCEAAAWIGLGLLEVLPEIPGEAIATVRAVSLAQLETAREVVEAENARPGARIVRLVCDDTILPAVKRYADSVATF